MGFGCQNGHRVSNREQKKMKQREDYSKTFEGDIACVQQYRTNGKGFEGSR